MRISSSAYGYYCKPCIHETFWTMQMINLTVGWWGIVSMILTPVYVLTNFVHYIPALFMASEHPGPRSRSKAKKKPVRRRRERVYETDAVDDSDEEDPPPRRRK